MRRNGLRRVLAIALFVAILSAFSTQVGADSPVIIDVGSSGTASGPGWTYSGGVFTVSGDVTITGTTRENRVVVAPGANVKITLEDVSIDRSADASKTDAACAFNMAGATVELTLSGENKLESGLLRAGLQAPAGATLTIGGQGSLTAISYNKGLGIQNIGGGAGIGGGVYNNLGQNCGRITINGGTIVASGGHLGAGIGGGAYQTINQGQNNGVIVINDGYVTASGGDDAAGIGGGFGFKSGDITIRGGIVIANGNGTGGFYGGAGIGGGARGAESGAENGSITISGGIITAKGGGSNGSYGGAGIGGGYNGSGGTITINGGDITAIGGGETTMYGASGIGPGSGGKGGSLTIMGGSVTARSAFAAAININLSLTMPAEYMFWTNTVNSDPGGAGTEYPPTAYSASNTNRFVNILSKYSYLVTFVDWDGSVLYEQVVAPGGAATAPPDPVREGYEFVGWDKPFSNITGNLTVSAQYMKTTVDITRVKINIPVLRGETYRFEVVLNQGASKDGIIWSVSNEALARVNGDGSVTILNSSGSVTLTARDPVSGNSDAIELWID